MRKLSGIFQRFPKNSFCRTLWTRSALKNYDLNSKKDSKYIKNRKFPERVVRIETCGHLYDRWRSTGKFRKIPDGDLTFDVPYIDTLHGPDGGDAQPSNVNDDSAVVLTFHGAPGSYDDYGSLTTYLYERGVRVIAPCFPDLSAFPPGVFRHSAEEKTQYIRDFLKAINVSEIDMLVCHSGSVYPGLQLCHKNEMPKIKTLALFNPGAYSTKIRAISPFGIFKAWVKFCETDIGFKLYQKYGMSVLKRVNLVVRVDDVMKPLLTASTMVYGGIPESKHLLHELSQRQFPIFIAFSKDDKLIQKELSYQVAYKLGLLDHHIGLVDENGEIMNEGATVKNVKAIAFENGSHYVFWKYPHIIHEQLYLFLQKYAL